MGASVAGGAPPPPGEDAQEDLKRLTVIEDALDRIGWLNMKPKLDRRALTRADVQLTFDAFEEYKRSLRKGGVKSRPALFGSIFNRLQEERYG